MAANEPVHIESLDQEGRGIAHVDGKVVFIGGALPGERVSYSVYRRKPKFDLADITSIAEPSSSRVQPRCAFFGVCGGCSLQHMDVRTQVAVKQRVLEDALAHIGKVAPRTMLPAIHGEPWGYRHRARFTARFVPKKGGVLVGFHERRHSFVADMTSCEVIPKRISDLLPPLRALIGELSIRERVPQVELAIGHEVDALVFRILQPLAPDDERRLREFADRHRVQLYLQPQGPASVTAFYPSREPLLHYLLPEFELKIAFSPVDFTQVNHAVNSVLVRRAIGLLDPRPGERIADMFCGIGNFTLPIARRGASVIGVEGSAGLVARAASNARLNGLEDRATFMQANLFAVDGQWLRSLGPLDRMLIDPPRDGAVELVKALETNAPRRIVYVSCNPATLARDAGVLVQAQGYVLEAAGVVNMFPHTSHVESIAVFNRDD